MTPNIVYSPEVLAARDAGTPLVALESTIITHGMPWPQNVETARAVEAEVRANGATPATMAVIDGTVQVGLTDPQLVTLAGAKNVAKLSRADLAACLATGGTGATTVAATMIAARLAGIEVFATGGVGGVHRGADTTFDISADLHELAQTPVTVVCAGAKAILDLPKTLEVLETLGVPVIAFGQDALPAFWSRDSGLAAPLRMDSAAKIAAKLRLSHVTTRSEPRINRRACAANSPYRTKTAKVSAMNTAPSNTISCVALAADPDRNGGISARKKIDSFGFRILISAPRLAMVRPGCGSGFAAETDSAPSDFSICHAR